MKTESISSELLHQMDGYWRAAIFIGRSDLPLRQSVAQESAQTGAHQTATARTLGLLIHRLTYRRTNHDNIHVRGYNEEGTTTTPFDMVVMNELDRFHLVAEVINRVPTLGHGAAHAQQALREKLIEHKQHIAKYGEDLPEIRNWKWDEA